MRRRDRRRGAAFLLAMFIVSFAGLYAAVSTSRSLTELRVAQRTQSSISALDAADAAVDFAIRQLLTPPSVVVNDDANNNNRPDSPGPFPTTAARGEWRQLPVNIAAPGFYWTRVTNEGGQLFRMDARGFSGGVRRRIEIFFQNGGGSMPPSAITSLDGELTSATDEPGSGSFVQINGDVIANHKGPNTIDFVNVRVVLGVGADGVTPNGQAGSIQLLGAPSSPLPSLYLDPGRLLAPIRAPSVVLGGIPQSWGGVLPYDVRLRSANGAPPNSQETRVSGSLTYTNGAKLGLPKVVIPPHPAIGAFTNDCTHHFVFEENGNSLTRLPSTGTNGPLLGVRGSNRLLPGGTTGNPLAYCFASFTSRGVGAADTPRVMFDGPVTIYIDATVDPAWDAANCSPTNGACARVFFGRTSDSAANGDNSYVNYRSQVSTAFMTNVPPVDPDTGTQDTRPAKDLWFMVKGASNVDLRYSHVSASIYAPESNVAIRGQTGGRHLRGRLIGKKVDLYYQAKVQNKLDASDLLPPGFGGAPRIVAWRECRNTDGFACQ